MNSDSTLPMQIKANRDGFILVPDPGAPFQSIMAYMQKRLEESSDFFSRSEMILDLRAKPLKTDEILSLRKLLSEKAGVKLLEVKLDEDFSFVLDRTANLSDIPSRGFRSHAHEAAPIIVRSTCRSGTRVESPADCVVLGDVNPGAEIIAVGDIIVFGSLRGVAHAGATGNYAARIWALSIEPNQIRIADLVAIPPRGAQPAPKRFEVALIKENMIEVITM